MKPSEYKTLKVSRALRDIIMDSSEQEIREALIGSGENFEALVAEGCVAFQRALANVENNEDLPDLRRGLGMLIQLLRRRERLSVDELANKARVNAAELRRIERDATFEPHPRTIFQMERHFQLPPRVLVILSGAVRVGNEVREEALRFAAISENISELSREEREILNRFVKFLQEHTDR